MVVVNHPTLVFLLALDGFEFECGVDFIGPVGLTSSYVRDRGWDGFHLHRCYFIPTFLPSAYLTFYAMHVSLKKKSLESRVQTLKNIDKKKYS